MGDDHWTITLGKGPVARFEEMEEQLMDRGERSGKDRPAGWLLLILALVASGGCAMVGPDYTRPTTTLPTEWSTPLRGGVMTGIEDRRTLATWWKTLDDATLSSLMDRAVQGNLDLKKARSRVREARALQGVTRAGLFPTVDASGSLSSIGGGKDANLGNTTDLYRTGLDASWELDVFGGVRRSVEAAGADVGASEEDLRDVLVSLLSEVALNYVEARTFQARLAVAEANLTTQDETYQLTRWRNEAGLSDELAVQQARYNLENTRSQLPTFKAGLEEAMNRLAVLLGKQPGALRKEMETARPIPVTPPEVAIGIPADILRQRPDVRRAERQLAAETARIGVARVNLYPKFTLNGSIGLESLSPSRLFSSVSKVFSYVPRITWPVFDAGAIRSKIEVQSAIQEQSLIRYEAAVLTALEDVENALVAYAEEQQREASLAETSRAAQLAAQLAEHKYGAGLTDFTSVLDAQRALRAFQDQLAQSDGAVTSNLVRLYKALGGGWTCLLPEKEQSSRDGENR
jgi:outer membrane protein, multidrug efflux system